jgi:hypothetical protein
MKERVLLFVLLTANNFRKGANAVDIKHFSTLCTAVLVPVCVKNKIDKPILLVLSWGGSFYE